MEAIIEETAEEKIIRLEIEIDNLKKNNNYFLNGGEKLYYALQRKESEMAEILNRYKLQDINIDDPKDKTFERLKFIWNDASELATSVKGLGTAIGITGDEEKDTKKPFVDTIAEDRK